MELSVTIVPCPVTGHRWKKETWRYPIDYLGITLNTVLLSILTSPLHGSNDFPSSTCCAKLASTLKNKQKKVYPAFRLLHALQVLN